MNKKLILVAAAAGLVSFAGAFVTGWLSRPQAALGSAPGGTAGPTNSPSQALPVLLTPAATAAENATGTRAMTEQQLKELIQEIRGRMQEYDRKLQDLEKERERMQIARQTLKKDIDTLNNLQVELAASTASLKSERDALLKTRIEIDQVEKNNLTALAAAYDKMDAARAGEIFKSMAQGGTPNATSRVWEPGQVRSGTTPSVSADDAVKILRYMQERTKAKVLSEMAATEPALAAALSLRLKQITEKK